MRQVSKHASDETCWIVVNGKVYDVTSYIDDHPGGAESILLNAGVDCTDEFMGVHSQEAKDLLEKFVIGTVKPGTKKPPKQPAVVLDQAAAAADPKVPLVTLQDPRERSSAELAAMLVRRYALPLAVKRRLNHDTYFMRFALPSPRHLLGLPCGKHVFLCADIGGEGVVRAYTPISGNRDPGVLEFLIKEGDVIDVKGPYGKFHYEGQGHYTLNRVPGQARYLSMISGGSGITPCYRQTNHQQFKI
ncbi:cytochrome b5-like heme/steroid binding domain-containing protein [Scenedesmus sp. NREL 46B-D3]|nr:cytochrome b5-like heme/steroid binding domain-containing protein [Scenedesmus sp. NREL 46B-D3]